MQITEQLIERIARRVFNSMFASSLRQSNVQGGGTPSSVRYAEEAGHAASADTVAWTGVSGKPSFATVATSGSYNDLSNKPSIPTPSSLHSGYAANADYAVTAGSASSAAYATNANYATSAGNADTVDGYHESAFLHLSGGTMTGNISIGNSTFYASGTNGGINSLALADDCILGDCNIGGHLGLKSLNTSNAGISFYNMSSGGLGRITTDGTFHFYTSAGGYADVHANKGIAEDTWSSKSDARLKNVLGDVNLTVEQIAAMPSVRFTWKNRNDHRVHVGTMAQGIQKVMPEVVGETDGGILTVAYAEAAFVSVVKVAQKVLELEKLIKYGAHQ